jgi:hypothetical protein
MLLSRLQALTLWLKADAIASNLPSIVPSVHAAVRRHLPLPRPHRV